MSTYPGAPMQGYPPAAPGDYPTPYPQQQQQPQTPYPVAANGGGASAPPLSSFEKMPGYENVTYDNAILTPPTVSDWTGKPPPERKEMSNMPHFTAEEVREAVIHLASENCCYGSGTAKDMQITDINMSSAFHYTLETFGEKRESAWKFEPYKGQNIDGPMNGPAPAPWDVMVLPQTYFQGTKSKMEVPHTAFIKPCHVCVGNGRVRCESCSGMGQRNCTWCNGSGRRKHFEEYEPCSSCNSTGHDRCFTCSGSGQIKCKTCDGQGNLKGFVELTVTWQNHLEDYISETSAMPKELIRNVSGQVVFQEQMPRVWPINHAIDPLVNEASNNLVTKHNTAFPNERILQQRHNLQIVPIAKCNYTWRDTFGNFCVYGFEQKVHFPDYPQKCCCGCVIL